MPKVSIIIPYFNQDRELLVRSVQSVLQQSCKDFEIIIVNDGSDQEHTMLLKDLYADQEQITIITTENHGVSAARNLGVQKAEGRFVTFLDADDELMPFFLQEAVSIAESEGSDWVIGGIRAIRGMQDECIENGSLNSRVSKNSKSDLKRHMVNDLITFEGGYIGRGPVSRLLKRKLALLVPFDPGVAIGEDIIWNLRLLDQCNEITIVKRVWYRYYENPLSATKRYNPDVILQTANELDIISQLIDLKDDGQYLAFCNHIFEELKRINDCLICRKEWKALSNEKRSTIQKIYSTAPWITAGSGRLFSLGNVKTKVKVLLFKSGQLFRAWKYMTVI